MLIRNKI